MPRLQLSAQERAGVSDMQNGFRQGSIAVLRYVLPDGRIEMAWPCRVVEDSDQLVALFIAAGTKYKADPKRTAAEKRANPAPSLPSGEYVWTADTLRVMLPQRMHSVWLFWDNEGSGRQFSRYFVNIEEPFRRTAIGFDTQDLTVDLIVQPDLTWSWRDEVELQNHVNEGFFTEELAKAARDEGRLAIEEILQGSHPALSGWREWEPPTTWEVPEILDRWASAPPTWWDRRAWAYGIGE